MILKSLTLFAKSPGFQESNFKSSIYSYWELLYNPRLTSTNPLNPSKRWFEMFHFTSVDIQIKKKYFDIDESRFSKVNCKPDKESSYLGVNLFFCLERLTLSKLWIFLTLCGIPTSQNLYRCEPRIDNQVGGLTAHRCFKRRNEIWEEISPYKLILVNREQFFGGKVTQSRD